MAKKICNEPGCNELINKSGPSKCDKHIKNRHKQYRAKRIDTNELEFYSSNTWRRLRNYKIKMDPLCEKCLDDGIIKMATTVHHIKELKKHRELGLTIANLMSICNSCHNKIHRGKND